MIGSRALGCTLALATACSSETGIVIEVTRDPATTDRIDTLRFFVGVQEGGGQVSFVDPDPEAPVEVGGRDLIADPYRLLLRPAGSRERVVRVAVAGAFCGEIVAFGALDEPVEFQEGAVLKWTVVLAGDARPEITDTGCVSWDDGDIASAKDKDCDGFTPADGDCDDDDPAVYPGAPEYCGSGDSSCDGPLDQEPCFVFEAEVCTTGTSTCSATGRSECLSADRIHVIPSEACQHYTACLELGVPDPYGCTLDKLGASSHVCTLDYEEDSADLCPDAGARLPSLAPPPCRWAALIGAASSRYDLKLFDLDSDAGAETVVMACNARFELAALRGDAPPQRDRFLFQAGDGEQRLSYVDVRVRPRAVDSCPDVPLRCDGLLPP
jgi:hypothetical protein